MLIHEKESKHAKSGDGAARHKNGVSNIKSEQFLSPQKEGGGRMMGDPIMISGLIEDKRMDSWCGGALGRKNGKGPRTNLALLKGPGISGLPARNGDRREPRQSLWKKKKIVCGRVSSLGKKSQKITREEKTMQGPGVSDEGKGGFPGGPSHIDNVWGGEKGRARAKGKVHIAAGKPTNFATVRKGTQTTTTGGQFCEWGQNVGGFVKNPSWGGLLHENAASPGGTIILIWLAMKKKKKTTVRSIRGWP